LQQIAAAAALLQPSLHQAGAAATVAAEVEVDLLLPHTTLSTTPSSTSTATAAAAAPAPAATLRQPDAAFFTSPVADLSCSGKLAS
jgi:hypothetical protein